MHVCVCVCVCVLFTGLWKRMDPDDDLSWITALLLWGHQYTVRYGTCYFQLVHIAYYISLLLSTVKFRYRKLVTSLFHSWQYTYTFAVDTEELMSLKWINFVFHPKLWELRRSPHNNSNNSFSHTNFYKRSHGIPSSALC